MQRLNMFLGHPAYGLFGTCMGMAFPLGIGAAQLRHAPDSALRRGHLPFSAIDRTRLESRSLTARGHHCQARANY
jgi:hypothetical protein